MFKHVYQLFSIFILGSDGKPGLVTQLAVKLWKGKPQSEVPHGDRTRRTRPNCSAVEGTEGICEVKAAQFSRLLYTNPVCILSSCNERLQRNLMTISWLTPLDNQGRDVFHQQTSALCCRGSSSQNLRAQRPPCEPGRNASSHRSLQW